MTTITMTNRWKFRPVYVISPRRNSSPSRRRRIESIITTTIGPQIDLPLNPVIARVIAPPPARPLLNIPRRPSLWNAKMAPWNTRKIPVIVRPIRATSLHLKVLMSHALKDCATILQVYSVAFFSGSKTRTLLVSSSPQQDFKLAWTFLDILRDSQMASGILVIFLGYFHILRD